MIGDLNIDENHFDTSFCFSHNIYYVWRRFLCNTKKNFLFDFYTLDFGAQ